MTDLLKCPKCNKITLVVGDRIMTCVNPNCNMQMIPQDESNSWYIEDKSK